MKVFSVVVLPVLLISVTADKRVRPFSFQRQTASSSAKPPASEPGPYPPSGWKPEKPQTSTEPSGPYPPSGWKPDGPQLEAGPPPQKPDSSTPAPDTETSTPSNTDAPAKFVSFARPQNTVYYVLSDRKYQQLLIAPQTAALVTSAPYRQVNGARPLQLQVFDSHVFEVEPPSQGPIYAYSGQLVRVVRKV